MTEIKPAILVTGGAGAIGSALVERLAKAKGNDYTIRVFDSDEYAVWQLQKRLKGEYDLRFFVGSVRDYPRVEEAMYGVKHVFHCAALKHVSLCEYNPFDAVETNVIGTQNVIRAAISSGTVEKFLYVSTDKAVNPTSLMGATKLIGERLIIAAKYVTGARPTKLSAARFPNVIQTRGNVFEAWRKQLKSDGKIIVTDPKMKRYFLQIDSALDFLLEAFEYMNGSEVFVPSLTKDDQRLIVDVAKEWLAKQKTEGEIVFGTPEPGEKLFEKLWTEIEEPTVERISDIMSVIRFP